MNHVEIAVTDAAGRDSNHDFARLRILDRQVFDDEALARRVEDGGFHSGSPFTSGLRILPPTSAIRQERRWPPRRATRSTSLYSKSPVSRSSTVTSASRPRASEP